MPLLCCRCNGKGFIKRPKTSDVMCRDCFYFCFEEEINWTIQTCQLFSPGDKVAIGASGGKDSTVLAHVIKTLNERHNYQIELYLLSIDEGITGYRDDSLETVHRNKTQYNMPLTILSYKDLYGWTMDDIVKKIGKKRNCTFCGVFRRQALDRGALLIGANKICTGHNADDIAETVLMNTLRGDIGRLKRCTNVITGSDGVLPRVKPLKYAYEKEIVMYAHGKKLDYFSTECTYAPNAYRGFARVYLKNLEKARPRAILDIISSGEQLRVKDTANLPVQGVCSDCGYISSQPRCQACLLLEGLNRGRPLLGVEKSKGISELRSNMKNTERQPFTADSKWIKQNDGEIYTSSFSGELDSVTNIDKSSTNSTEENLIIPDMLDDASGCACEGSGGKRFKCNM